jgi:hypothetical protein
MWQIEYYKDNVHPASNDKTDLFEYHGDSIYDALDSFVNSGHDTSWQIIKIEWIDINTKKL